MAGHMARFMELGWVVGLGVPDKGGLRDGGRQGGFEVAWRSDADGGSSGELPESQTVRGGWVHG